MARRLLAWVFVVPVAGVGILAAHELAYRLTATRGGSVHEYLAHAPQLLAVLASLGLVGLAVQERSVGQAPAWALALVAPLGFTCQEHVERLVHTGELPLLLTSPTFLLGLALQLPVALACLFVARRVIGTLAGVRRPRRSASGEAWLPLSTTPAVLPLAQRLPRATGRGPPALLAP